LTTTDGRTRTLSTEAEDKKLHMANRCILAQDQALYWADSEITFLRWKWDRTLQLAQELELEKLGLEDRLEQAHQRNGELVQLGLAAARASSEHDAVTIATLEARLRTAEERHWVALDTTRADRERLAEAKYLTESVGAAAANY
jgi:septum formation inhibitor MinC